MSSNSIVINEFKDAHYVGENLIDVKINHPVYGWIPYTIDPNDSDMTIDNNQLLSLIGDNIAAWIPPTAEQIAEKLEKENRAKRNFKLASEVDPIVMNSLRWNDLSQEKKNEWIFYRQALLDITKDKNWPNLTEQDWPVAPM